MGKQPRGPSIAVYKGMHPKQPVMQRRDRNKTVSGAKSLRRSLVKPGQPALQFVWRRGDMAPDLDVCVA